MGLDLDDVLGEDGTPDEAARLALETLPTYVEVSPSGRGLKFFGTGRATYVGGHECYDAGRFFTVTGRAWDGAPADVADIHDALRQLATTIPPKAAEDGVSGDFPHAGAFEGRWDELQSNSIVWWAGHFARQGQGLEEVLYRFRTKFEAGDIPDLDPRHPWTWPEVQRIVERIHHQNEEQHSGSDLREAWSPYMVSGDEWLRPVPPVQWVVEGYIPRGVLVVFHAQGGWLKTMLQLDMAVSVSTGGTWLPQDAGMALASRSFETVRGRVLIVDLERGRWSTTERIQAMLRARGIRDGTPNIDAIILPSSPTFDASDEKLMAEFGRMVGEGGYSLVVIDSLAIAALGIEENSAEMGGLLNRLKRVAYETNAAVVVIHHDRKAGGYRGSSAIEAAPDMRVHVADLQQGLDGDRTMVIRVEKTNLHPVPEFAAHFTYTTKPGSTQLATATFTAGERPGAHRVDPDADLKTIAKMVLRERGELNQTELADAVASSPGVSRQGRVIIDVLKHMASDGELRTRKGKRNAIIYSLPVARRQDQFTDAD